MKIFYTLLIVVIAMVLLVTAGSFINQFNLQVHQDSFIDGLIKYQVFALLVGTFTTVSILMLNPGSKQFLKVGQLKAIADKEKWLGINGKSSWAINGLQLLFFVSSATGIFMFLAVQYTGSLDNFRWSFIPLVVLFSCINALTEELIFRFGIIGGLFNQCSKVTILIVSAILFGVPHYFGTPSGITGVFMSGILGYILCKAAIETKGLGIALAIHFVLDVIIFTALFMMHVE